MTPFALAAPAPAQPGTPTERPLEERVAALRGLAFERPVEREEIPVDDLDLALAPLVAAIVPPGEEDDLVRLLSTLGLVPQGYPLREELLEVLREQVMAWYDPESGQLLVAADPEAPAWAPDELVLARELDRALVDQHWGLPLGNDDPQVREREDLLMARRALAEGDAALLMALFALDAAGVASEGRVGADPEALDRALEPGRALASPRLDAAAPWLRAQLIDPFVLGMQATSRAYEQGGWAAVDALWQDPPLSTEQLLHPGRDHRPEPVRLPEVDEGWWPALGYELGELGLRRWLGLRLPAARAAAAAAGWGGDRAVLLRRRLSPERGENGEEVNRLEHVVHLNTVWDAVAEAEEFAEAAEAWLWEAAENGMRWKLLRRGREVQVALTPPAEETILLGEEPWEGIIFEGPAEP